MSTKKPKDGYSLAPSQVPAPPASAQWVEQLRWCMAVMDSDPDELGFVAGLISYAIKQGGLTEKQAKYAQRLLDRVTEDWEAGKLGFQGGAAKRSAKAPANVVRLHAERPQAAPNP